MSITKATSKVIDNSIITGQTTIDSLTGNDTFLVHDASSAALHSATLNQLIDVMQPAGSIIQTVRSTDALVGYQTIQGAKFIPFGNTAPQSDEGEEVATVTITPQLSNSIIRINVSIPGVTFGTSAGYGIFAVFRGSATSAFASAFRYFASPGSYGGPVDFVVEDAPSTTSAITYRLRMGASFATSLKFGSGNTTGTQNLGNTVKMVMVASEIKA